MRLSIRRAQYTKGVIEGNPTMLIWLGKNELGQSDRHDHSVGGRNGEPVEVQVWKVGKRTIKF